MKRARSIYSWILEYFILPIGDFISGNSVMTSLHQLDQEVHLSEIELHNLQNKKLKKLLIHSVKNCEYYSDLDIEIKENDDFIKILKSFPILTKDDIRKNSERMISVKRKKLYAQKSSGSTGVPTKVYWIKKEFSRYRATTLLWWKWAGYEFGDSILQTGMTSKRSLLKHIKDRLFKTFYLHAYNHNDVDLSKALKWLNNQKKVVLGGYASSLYIIAKYCKENGITKDLKTCISWGDKLFDKYKVLIEEVFNCKVFNTYGSSEGFMIASQKDLEYMYIMAPNVYLEIVDDNGVEVPDGTMGHVVVTNLNNYGMPLIRYKLGDLAIKLPKSKYPLNRDLELPVLQQVIGRDTDIVLTPKGKKLSVHSFNSVLEHFELLKQFQIVQYDIKGVEIKYVELNELDSSYLKEIESKLALMIGENGFQLTLTKVTKIASSKSGKPEMVISHINKK
ncbi:phenylacetate--CoA ligase family protein [Saccharicrinis aurantiacus]|uniref:phenylacetate--CoA ligase family protein n=1 Tax=Saccharicrinis aurantiacus TaxID=1849719 RepID=UPI000838AE8D|nr:phenylacetate--CoA ligase family protein [Saccharicrinis aurantiacus]